MNAYASMLLTVAALGCGAEAIAPAMGPCGASVGHVARVIDGDTVALADGRRIRFLLVDTPELSRSGRGEAECFAIEAAARSTELLLGEQVRLEYDSGCRDKYGRSLAYLWRAGRMVNRLLVLQGYARVMVVPPNQRYAEEFRQLEAEARSAQAGLWGVCQ